MKKYYRTKPHKWTGEALADLLRLPINEVAEKYGVTENYVKTQKSRAKRRIMNSMDRASQNPENISPEELEDIERLREILQEFQDAGLPVSPRDAERVRKIKTWTTSYKDADGEGKTLVNRAVELRVEDQEAEDADFISQAAPVEITPSKEKPVKRDHRLLFIFSDAQMGYRKIGEDLVPTHDEAAMRVARLLCKDLKPDEIVNLGDTVDLPQLGKYDPDSNHFLTTLQESFNRAHSFYAELRADNPNAKIVEVDSNHNVRLGKFVLRKAMEFYGLRQAGAPPESWPVLTYPFLANLDDVGVEWYGGYGAAKYVYGEDGDLIFIHGQNVRSNGSTADLLSKKYPYQNVVAGHGHKIQTHTRTAPDGTYLTAAQIGALCDTKGSVPGYGSGVDDLGIPVESQQDWQQGVMIIEDYGDGDYNFLQIPIREGRAHYQGREYSSEG